MLPSANQSVPFLLVRASADAQDDDEDFDTQVDARKAVKPRRPPPRANVKVDDLPSVIVDETGARERVVAAPADSGASVVVDVDDDWHRRSNPTLVTRSSPAPAAKPKGRVGRTLAAAVVTLGVVGAVGSALGVVDVHTVMPRAIASILHR